MTTEYKKALEIFPDKDFKTLTYNNIIYLSEIMYNGERKIRRYDTNHLISRYWCNKLNVSYNVLPKYCKGDYNCCCDYCNY